MTVQELALRIARHTDARALSNLDATDKLIVLDCINTAIYNWFAAAPEHMRTTRVSHLVRPSETLNVTMTQYGNDLVGPTLQDYHLGASVVIGGDGITNEIVSTDPPQVLNAFRGSTGATTASVYFDTIMLTDYGVSRLVNDPRILDNGRKLVRDDRIKFMGAERKGLEHPLGHEGVGLTRNFGEPYRYSIENTGVSLKDEARIMVRMDPMPEGEMTITFDAAIEATEHQLDEMNGAVTVAVPQPYVLPHIVPLALGELAVSPIWGVGDADKAIEKGLSIIAKIQAEVPLNEGLPRNRARTRPGW